jgi:putative FmdB family regulatory protein
VPTYQYLCTECGEALEAQQSFSDDPLTVCPVCQGRLRKVFNAVGVVFKGSGFYRNDSRSTTSTDGSKGDAAPSGGSKTDAPTKEPAKAKPAKDSSTTTSAASTGG